MPTRARLSLQGPLLWVAEMYNKPHPGGDRLIVISIQVVVSGVIRAVVLARVPNGFKNIINVLIVAWNQGDFSVVLRGSFGHNIVEMVQLELDERVVVVVISWIGHLHPEFQIAAFEHELTLVC